MKNNNLLKFTMWMFGLFCTMALAFIITSCHNKYANMGVVQEDSTSVIDSTSNRTSPTFTSVTSLLEYKKHIVAEDVADSVIQYTPNSVLENVSKVLLYRQNKFTKLDLAEEYLSKPDIYNVVTRDIGSSKPPEDNYTSISYKDSIIDGKKVKIVTKIY